MSTRLYDIWHHMKQRCHTPGSSSYKNYGAKGIRVCEEWGAFARFKEWAFSSGYANNLEIDRIDSRQGYCPENCRWATSSQQCVNIRRPRGVSGYRGVTKVFRSKKWRASICETRNGREVRRHLGGYATKLVAALVYDDAAYAMYGEFAVLNFPERIRARQKLLAALKGGA